MKRAIILFCVLLVLTLAVPAITNAAVQHNEKKQSAQSELATIFNETG